MALFKTYPNKKSTSKQLSRYRNGGVSEETESKLKWWERDNTIMEDAVDDEFVYITPEIVNRPSKIAYELYGLDSLLWVILMKNKIVDLDDLKVGMILRVPSPARVSNHILTN